MLYFDPVYFPIFNAQTSVKDKMYVNYINPFLLLSKIGINTKDIFDLQCLEAWIPPNNALNIHKDLNNNLVPNISWSLVCSPVEYNNCYIDIYEETSVSKISEFGAPSNFKMPCLDEKSSTLVESWSMLNGSCIFDAGNLWHTARNNSAEPANIFSFRSKRLDSLDKLKCLLELHKET